MSIALCFSGQVRDFFFASTSFRKYILTPLLACDPYVFVHTPDKVFLPRIISAIGVPVDRVIAESEDETVLESPAPIADVDAVINRDWHQGNSFRRFYLQLRSIHRAHALCAEFSRTTGVQFDWVFRLRFDNLYFGESLEDLHKLDPSAIYIPQHDNWAGLNDRFSFGGPASMQAYCSRYTLFSEYQEQGYPMHPESFLQWTLKRSGIPVKRTRVTLHLIRYGSLWPATFQPLYGDSALPGNLWLWAVWSRLFKTRLGSLASRFYLLTIRVEQLIFQLQHPFTFRLQGERHEMELQSTRRQLS